MRRITYSHLSFVHGKLMNLLQKDSFALRLRKSIGGEIDSIFENSVYENENENESWFPFFPVRALFEWIAKNGGITADELADEEGQIFDDHGELIPTDVIRSISGVEQMAAFGLWFVDCELDICGQFTEEDYDENRINPHGWREAEVVHHKAECLLNAYQALSYAERLGHKVKLSADEVASVARLNFSSLGKDGADKRHAPMRALRAWVIEQYLAGKWVSANQAAHDLMERVMEHGRTINAILQPSNAQRTIAAWINASINKNKMSF